MPQFSESIDIARPPEEPEPETPEPPVREPEEEPVPTS